MYVSIFHEKRERKFEKDRIWKRNLNIEKW